MSTLTNIQILRSAVPHKRPDPSFLLDGQLALNYKQDDPGLYAKLQDGSMFKIGPASYTTTGVAPNQNPGAGGVSGNLVGEEWNDARAAYYTPFKKFYNGTTWQTVGGWDVDDATGNLTCLKAINISTLEVDAARVNGALIVDGDVTPNGTSCIHDLGKLSERWKGGYFCELDLLGSLSIGADLVVNGGTTIGLGLSVGGDITVSGEATFGTDCNNNKFTVKSPTYLNCDTEIKGDLLLTSSLEVIGNAEINGNVTVGAGCGVTSLTVLSDTVFKCDVQFVAYPITFEHLIISNIFDVQGDTILGGSCADDTLTVNSTSDFNCLTTFHNEVRVGRGATQPQFTTFGPNFFHKDIETGSNLQVLTGKGYSLPTVDADPDNTLITKKWAEDMALDTTLARGVMVESGISVKTNAANGVIVPNGGSSKIGLSSERWSEIWANDVHSQNFHTGDLHLKNERGDWTMIEEEDVLTLRNNKTGKRYAISMTPYAG